MKNHIRTCKGKYLYPCDYCQQTFMERDEYASHLVNTHRPKTDFKETGIFIGDTNSKTIYNEHQQPVAAERTLVYMEPNVMTEEQIFNPAVISSLRDLLRFEIALSKRVSVRLLCRALTQKFEDDNIITRVFYGQTNQVFRRNNLSVNLSFR